FGHLASLSGDHIIILGGRHNNNEYIHEVSVLDLKTHVWIKGGSHNGQFDQGRTTLTSVDEKPMVRRRRRYLECLATERWQNQKRPLSSSSLNTTSLTTGDIGGTFDHQGLLTPISPTSPSAMITPLLNPRMNSWYRGEGFPFEIPTISAEQHKSEPVLSLPEQDSSSSSGSGGTKEGGSQLNRSSSLRIDSHLGNNTDSESLKPASKSSLNSQVDAAYKTLQSFVTAPVTINKGTLTATSSSISIMSSGSEKSRSRSHSHVSTPISTQPWSSSTGGPQARAKSTPQTPVTHAVPKKFFAKSNGSMFDLDGLATIIAREQKANQQPPSSPKNKEASNKTSVSRENSFNQLKRRDSNSASSTSSRRSSGYLEETTKAVWRSFRGGPDGDDKADKRRSLDSVLDEANIAGMSFHEDRTITEKSKTPTLPAPVSQPLFMYSNHVTVDNKLKREFARVQRGKGPYRPNSDGVLYDIRPEWTALELGSEVLGESEVLPPRMYYPAAHIVDHYFLLSGSSLDEGTTAARAPSSSSSSTDTGTTRFPSTSTTGNNSSEVTESSSFTRGRSYSVWMHHFHNHQWTQLELSTNLRSGEWNLSVLDRDSNKLYILGQKVGDWRDETHQLAFPEGVDLEGLEICPSVDESSVGPTGVRMGLDMLRDGVGADVVVVSTDGGRVHVNSGIVGQRWGYFQALMEERDRNIVMKMKEHSEGMKTSPSSSSVNDKPTKDRHSEETDPAAETPRLGPSTKRWYLNDKTAEVLVPESTPVLVGFLQYLYTNDLTTPHQRKLRTLQGLLLLAHFYDLSRLQQLVKRALYQKLNANNAHAIYDIALLTYEFGLQTRAVRTLQQTARMAQLRQQGEDAEAKRRLDFATSRREEYEEERKRQASMQAIHQMMKRAQTGSNISLTSTISGNGPGGGPGGSGGGPGGGSGGGNSFTFRSTSHGAGGGSSSNSLFSSMGGTLRPGTTAGSVISAHTFGRFFRQKEESTDSLL
ncbi:hypothetical protein BGZ65_004790, partial [Modicella reniformis]